MPFPTSSCSATQPQSSPHCAEETPTDQPHMPPLSRRGLCPMHILEGAWKSKPISKRGWIHKLELPEGHLENIHVLVLVFQVLTYYVQGRAQKK